MTLEITPGDNYLAFCFSITRGGLLWSGGIYRTPVIMDMYSSLALFITRGLEQYDLVHLALLPGPQRGVRTRGVIPQAGTIGTV